ncbi:MAG TPA: MFS transporter [Candidatus Limnocylindrales bacterium]|nr:MFS transporter [Candidatus Limnocylindrales bacterium]
MSTFVAGLRSSALLRPLRNTSFRDFWLGQVLVSSTGDQITLVALTWLALELTDSGLALGAVLTAAAIPRALLMLVGGAASDHWSPRSVMLVTNAVRGVVTAALGVLVLTGELQFWQLLILAASFGVMDAFFYPAESSIVPGLVPSEALEPANALAQGTMQLAGLIGPAVGGILVAAVSTAPAFLLDAVTFLVGVLALARVHYVRPTSPAAHDPQAESGTVSGGPAGGRLLSTIRAGFRYAWDDRGLRAILIMIAAVDFAFIGAIAVGLAWLADTRFGGAADFGFMLAGWSGGALLGAIVAGSVGQVRRAGVMLIVIIGAMGLGLGLIGLAPSAGLIIGVLGLMGLGNGFVNVTAIAGLQRRVEPRMLGRVMSLVMLASTGLSPISLAVAGPLVEADTVLYFLACGAIVVIATAVGLRLGAGDYFEPRPEPPGASVSAAKVDLEATERRPGVTAG